MKFFALIWSNLVRRKTRTFLTVLSVFVAFLLYGVLCCLKEAFVVGVTLAGQDRLMTRHKVSLILDLPVSYTQQIEQVEGVDTAVHFTWFNGLYQNDPKKLVASFPTLPLPFMKVYPEYAVSDAEMKTFLETRNAALVGPELAKMHGWKVGDTVALTSPLWPNKDGTAWDFLIAGIYSKSNKIDPTGFYFRYDYFDESRAQGEGKIGWFGVKVKDPAQADAVAKAVDLRFANSPYETKTEPESAMAQGFAQQLGDIGAITMSILGAVFFTILLVSGNTMAQAVRERTEELGVLKAIGFNNSLVLTLILVESCILAAIGGVAGILVSYLFSLGGSPVPNFLPLAPLPPIYLIVGALLVLALGLITGLIPAVQAMRLQIAAALGRHA